MRINNNIQALNAYNNLNMNQFKTSRNLEKLSSGLRINRASDDAAGLAISEKMRGQIRGLAMAERNIMDGISLLQTGEAAMQGIHDMLQRMRELAVQAANDTYMPSDREEINKEIQELKNAINDAADNTNFNTKKLLDGSLGNKVTELGKDADLGKVIDSSGNPIVYTGQYIDANGDLQTVTSGAVYLDQFGNPVTKVEENGKTVTYRLGHDANAGVSGAAVMSAPIYFDKQGVLVDKAGTFVGLDGTPDPALTSGAVTLNIENGKGLVLQIGPNENQNVVLKIEKMTTVGIGLIDEDGEIKMQNSIEAVDVVTRDGASHAITVVDEAIKQVASQRASIGAVQNRMEQTMNNVAVARENMAAAESRIRDSDMAKEMTEFTRNNILNQAATAMLAQANQLPQGVLQLLQ